ncbi:uncharacterized protein LOC135147612 isoform X2 [Daucus carota subsp. sativus]|uniref:uncharacterized protein LOC135147612 isoform X2 n=1 Tax=Daucus carota subsp. sativus TaxID=79200 RepID=UPI003082B500
MVVSFRCDLETEIIDGHHSCQIYERIVPHPEIRYHLVVIAGDTTGSIEVRSVIGKRARQIVPKLQLKDTSQSVSNR